VIFVGTRQNMHLQIHCFTNVHRIRVFTYKASRTKLSLVSIFEKLASLQMF
jgi:hypothetical protein